MVIEGIYCGGDSYRVCFLSDKKWVHTSQFSTTKLKMNDVITIRVCSPSRSVLSVAVSLDDQITILQDQFPSAPRTFVYNGQILLNSLTFGFYDLHNDDFVVAVPAENTNILNPDSSDIKWRRMTKNYDEFSEKMRCALNPVTAGEFARLRDLEFARVEKNHRNFTKLCQIYSNPDDIGPDRPRISTVLDWGCESPNTEPLPILWEPAEECLFETRRRRNNI